jgi:excisionase family DNA binding protein
MRGSRPASKSTRLPATSCRYSRMPQQVVRRTSLLSERALAAIESLLTPSDASRRLGVDEATIRRAIAEGRLPGVRIGGEGRRGRTMIFPADLARFAHDRRVRQVAERAAGVRARDYARAVGPGENPGPTPQKREVVAESEMREPGSGRAQGSRGADRAPG